MSELRSLLESLYGGDPRFEEQWSLLRAAMQRAADQRPQALRRLDEERRAAPDWLQREDVVGYVTYVDRFAGTLAGLREHLPYLRELGITYLHLMPLLHARPVPNDGGYAVVDYEAVDPALGTMDDLRALAADLHAAGIALCIDVVLNHTAREHVWARAAMAGDDAMLARYLTFPDRSEPDAYEASLRHVFPDTAPGNFTWSSELERWVWTTFHDYQWDLDYSNPEVFRAMAEAMLGLANVGVDVMRLDAVPFLWKRLGTGCENLPEVHVVLGALREVMREVAPGVAFKAEAIVAPQQLVAYLGECDLAYHNVLMALSWSALASGRAALITSTLREMPAPPPHAAWCTYVRGHDDIGWAITPEDASSVGEDAAAHRRFLADFYAGDHPMSFARGARFQPQPESGEARTSGSTASLAGVEHALETRDGVALELAIRRIVALHAIAFAHGGIPLLYMGDEIGLRNDAAWRSDPARREDNRWMHRPPMDWRAAQRRHDASSVEGRVWARLQALAVRRRATAAVHARGSVEPFWTGNDHVFGLRRAHGGDTLELLVNLVPVPQQVGVRTLEPYEYVWQAA